LRRSPLEGALVPSLVNMVFSFRKKDRATLENVGVFISLFSAVARSFDVFTSYFAKGCFGGYEECRFFIHWHLR